MSALVKLLETTHELVTAKIKTIEQYEAQIDSVVKAGNRIGAGINEVSSVVQNIRTLINHEYKQIQELHNKAAGELRSYMQESKDKSSVQDTRISVNNRTTRIGKNTDHTDHENAEMSNRYGVTMIVSPPDSLGQTG